MERRQFTREFKLEAVRLTKQRGVSYAQASKDLGVHSPSGPNLTLRFAWGFPEAFACASLGDARTNQYPIEPSRPQQA
jgi:hypothetical protein